MRRSSYTSQQLVQQKVYGNRATQTIAATSTCFQSTSKYLVLKEYTRKAITSIFTHYFHTDQINFARTLWVIEHSISPLFYLFIISTLTPRNNKFLQNNVVTFSPASANMHNFNQIKNPSTQRTHFLYSSKDHETHQEQQKFDEQRKH